MKKLVLDTSVLLRWWNQCRSKHPGPMSPDRVQKWARQLVKLHDTDAIVTPVFIEVVGGAMSKQELKLLQAYLDPFRCIDDRRILPEDWENAIRLAQRIPEDRRPRQLADCLIRAIADRLNYEVLTFDQGFPG